MSSHVLADTTSDENVVRASLPASSDVGCDMSLRNRRAGSPLSVQLLDELEKHQTFGMKFGLETIRHLLRGVGEPEKTLRFIHIAGTNGKGSVAAMLESCLRHAGFRTGLYTSPHLVSSGERIQIDRKPRSADEMSVLYAKLRPAIQSLPEPPTYFEVTTAMAAIAFAEAKTDVVIWETGLGGRLDATNTVTPMISVLTPISLDHTAWLGPTIEAVAEEKCGIIKPSVTVVSSPQTQECERVIRAAASNQNAPLIFAGQEPCVHLSESLGGQSFLWRGKKFEMPLLGNHQLVNAATALATLDALDKLGLHVPAEALQKGFSSVRWDARFQALSINPPIILDGAHNPDGAARAAETFLKFFPSEPRQLIFGIMHDKDMESVVAALSPVAERILLVPINNPRSADPAVLKPLFLHARPGADVRVLALEDALREARHQQRPCLVAGSLFLAGEVLENRDRGQADICDY